MKKILMTLTMIIVLLGITGCGCANKDIWDLNYRFDYAECYLNGEYVRYDIRQWSDYVGEQIQIRSTDGKTYLISMNYCRMIKE